MIIYKKASPLQNLLHQLKNQGKKIAFIPTMGALHEGHLALIKQGKPIDKVTVCSIFVNPTQFNDKKDLEKYPITIESDIYMLDRANTEILSMHYVYDIYT